MIPVIGVGAEVGTEDLALQPTVGSSAQKQLAAVRDITGLPIYVSEVVQAVAAGVQTSHEFAKLRGMSVTNSSERFRVARRLARITPVDGRYLPPEGTRYTSDPSRSPQ